MCTSNFLLKDFVALGINESNGLRTIGFRLGSYVTGSVAVAPIDDVPNVPKRMKEAVNIFQNFIRTSDLDVFHPVKQEGKSGNVHEYLK